MVVNGLLFNAKEYNSSKLGDRIVIEQNERTWRLRPGYDIDISKYLKLGAFPKQESRGHKLKKAMIFTEVEIAKFLKENFSL